MPKYRSAKRFATLNNRRRNKASSVIGRAWKRSYWKPSYVRTRASKFWGAKTAKFGTKARHAQNKWRKNFVKNHGFSANFGKYPRGKTLRY